MKGQSRIHQKLYEKTTPRHDKLVMQCVTKEAQERFLAKIPPPEQTRHDDKFVLESCSRLEDPRIEIEYPVRSSSGFIVGWADIVFNTSRALKYRHVDVEKIRPIDLREIWQILIEVKPTIDSLGDTIRQVNTYRLLLPSRTGLYTDSRVRSFIATYEELSQDIIDFLLTQNIHVLHFKEVIA